jgi:hypothetical protein
MNDHDSKRPDHLYAVLFREAKIILSKYEDYLRDRITSKDLAQKMLNLKESIQRIEEYNKNKN